MSQVEKLRTFLRRFEVEDCDCPLLLTCPCGQECDPEEAHLCRHCSGQCSCQPQLFQPPCKHVTREPDPADLIRLRAWFFGLFPFAGRQPDLVMLGALCAYVNAAYKSPPAGAADLETQRKKQRINVMVRRFRDGLAVEHPWDRWRKIDRPEVGVLVSRNMNGSVNEDALQDRDGTTPQEHPGAFPGCPGKLQINPLASWEGGTWSCPYCRARGRLTDAGRMIYEGREHHA